MQTEADKLAEALREAADAVKYLPYRNTRTIQAEANARRALREYEERKHES